MRNYKNKKYFWFGHNRVVKELCDQQIIDFANSLYHCIERNSSGKVYCWGRNYCGELGIGSQDDSYHKPKLKYYLNNEFLVDISCGGFHSLVLTNCGEVYAWGRNCYGQLGIGNTVKSNEPKFVAVIDENKSNVFIEKISCGSCHSLL